MRVCICFAILLFPGIAFLFGENNLQGYPLIKELSRNDLFFRQLEEDVALFYRNQKAGKPIPPPLLFRYRVKAGENIYTLAARLNLPYESIALINSINKPEDLLPGREIVILNIPGLPIPKIPKTELELLIHSWRDLSLGIPITVLGREGQGREFLLLPGERFHTLELSYFLGILFRFPLKNANLSSGYGYRQNPFGGGDLTFHHGIDLVAPVGTEVYPAREGKVIDRGFDPVYGNLVVLSHPNGYETLYGHLDSIFVQLNQSISSNMILGTVGNTGLSTGPHLHFEVRRKGETTNPALLLPGIK